MNNNDYKLPANFGTIVTELRNQANLYQSDVAQKLTVDKSRVSRIESGNISLSRTEVDNLLQAINTQEAKDFQVFLNQEWNILDRPSFYHPQKDILYKAELSFQKLRNFREQEDLPISLHNEAQMYEKSLKDRASYIMDLRHSIAYIGNIGVGKTTALCTQTNLIFSKSNKSECVLETGAGGTTVCEVSIREGRQYAISVEPLEDTEVYKLVNELCAIYLDSNPISKEQSSLENQNKGVSKEIERALRNMTGLIRKTDKLPDGKKRRTDPLKELAEKSESLDDLCTEFNQKLSLWKRASYREIFYDKMSDMSGLEWLQENFKNINNGGHEDFSLPKRIDITVPFSPVDGSIYEIKLIDTKGVDQTAIRPDLQTYIDDPRTIVVLCSSFNEAPATSIQNLIASLNEAGKSMTLKNRIGILVLPKQGEAMAMKDDSGEPVEIDEEGYEMKSDQVEMSLNRIGIEKMEKHFFNSTSDDPHKLNQFIIKQLENLRYEEIKGIDGTCKAVDYLIENQEKEYVKISQKKVSEELEIFLRRHPMIPDHNWKIYIVNRLIVEIEETNARSLWASIRRDGSWPNFDIHFILGKSAMIEARECTLKIFDGLKEIVEQMLENEDFNPSHVFLKELESNWTIWYNNFIQSSYVVGSHIFRTSLEDDYIWTECFELYGQGKQFRNEVVLIFKSWFEDPDQEHLYKILEKRINERWQTEVLNQLRKLVDDR